MKTLLTFTCFCTFACAQAVHSLELAPGDFAFIQKSSVNLRATPSTQKAPLTQLMQGRAFMVLERKEDWLYGDVFRSGTGLDTLKGWVHQSLLDTAFPKGTHVPTTAAFEEFSAYINDENQTSLARSGVSRYLKVHNWGDGVVAVTVNRNWMDDDFHYKKTAFERLQSAWHLLDGNEMDEKLFILSPSGLVLMQQ